MDAARIAASWYQHVSELERVFVWMKSGFRWIFGSVTAKSCQFFRVADDVIV
jgi:hypothetical protein